MPALAAESSFSANRLAELGGHVDVIANARIMLEQARLLTLKAAWMLDEVGAKGARSEISQIKVVGPNIALQIIDQAIQMHGGCWRLARFSARRYVCHDSHPADCRRSDEVHRAVDCQAGVAKYRD